eukprot:g2282.t1
MLDYSSATPTNLFLETAASARSSPGTPGWFMVMKEFKIPWWCSPYMPPDVGGRGSGMDDGLWISHGCVNCPRSQMVGNMPRNPVLEMPMPVSQIATGRTSGESAPIGRRSMWDLSAAGYFNFKAVSASLEPASRKPYWPVTLPARLSRLWHKPGSADNQLRAHRRAPL